jgi:hypothetical protein
MPADKGSLVTVRLLRSAHGLNTYSRSQPILGNYGAAEAAFPSCLVLKP